jgi:hypothetical protein
MATGTRQEHAASSLALLLLAFVGCCFMLLALLLGALEAARLQRERGREKRTGKKEEDTCSGFQSSQSSLTPWQGNVGWQSSLTRSSYAPHGQHSSAPRVRFSTNPKSPAIGTENASYTGLFKEACLNGFDYPYGDCMACAPGFFLRNQECKPCEANFTTEGSLVKTLAAGGEVCTRCSLGYTTSGEGGACTPSISSDERAPFISVQYPNTLFIFKNIATGNYVLVMRGRLKETSINDREPMVCVANTGTTLTPKWECLVCFTKALAEPPGINRSDTFLFDGSIWVESYQSTSQIVRQVKWSKSRNAWIFVITGISPTVSTGKVMKLDRASATVQDIMSGNFSLPTYILTTLLEIKQPDTGTPGAENEEWVYAGTDSSLTTRLYRSADSGKNWSEIELGVHATFLTDIRFACGQYYLAPTDYTSRTLFRTNFSPTDRNLMSNSPTCKGKILASSPDYLVVHVPNLAPRIVKSTDKDSTGTQLMFSIFSNYVGVYFYCAFIEQHVMLVTTATLSTPARTLFKVNASTLAVEVVDTQTYAPSSSDMSIFSVAGQ